MIAELATATDRTNLREAAVLLDDGGWVDEANRIVFVPTSLEATVMESHQRRRQRIVILGGGMSALTAAFEITNEPDWQDKYEVDVYQMGWRLGGKGASGRNRSLCNRIEERGLHLWMGFYENAFRVMQQCYCELGRDPGCPLATWEDAFKPQDDVVLEEYMDGIWHRWPFPVPITPGTPGDGAAYPTPWECLLSSLGLLDSLLEKLFEKTPPDSSRKIGDRQRPPSWDRLRRRVDTGVEHFAELPVFGLVKLARQLAESLGPEWILQVEQDNLYWLVEKFLASSFWRDLGERAKHDNVTRRSWVILDFGLAVVAGVLRDRDRLFKQGLGAIDGLDFRTWLKQNGASDLTLDNSLLHGLYDLWFAYEGGDDRKPNLSAGRAILSVMLMTLGYKRALFWRIQAGMGDAVFAPLYLVLKQRGVRFHFFHRVRKLTRSDDGTTVGAVEIGRQATANKGEYDPLFEVKELPCWPSEPLYEQLEEGEELKAGGHNLESAWDDWPDRERIVLEAGEHFDRVILGVSLAALPDLCGDLIDHRPRWRQMHQHVQTTQTQAMQLWLQPNLAQSGWDGPKPVTSGYADPFNTWSDFDQRVCRESWPDDNPVGMIAYFRGPMKEDGPLPLFSDNQFPARQHARVGATARDFLARYAGHLWPQNAPPDNPQGLNFDLLVDQDRHADGQQRFHHQFWRGNIDPTERYVLSVAGSTSHRLAADESGYGNLVFTGDWIRNGLDLGCIEGAAIAGLQAARVVTNRPINIAHERDPFLRLDGAAEETNGTIPPKTTLGKNSVVILGGGVAGMTAAHELMERGFEQIKVFEQRSIPGGKARSFPVPGSGVDGRKDLPAEHGFHFFPRFYKHVTDTMRRIPFGRGRRVDDNLIGVSGELLATFGRPSLTVLPRLPRSRADLDVVLHDIFHSNLGLTAEDFLHYGDRLWQTMCSCRERFVNEYERIGWWHFIDADKRSEAYGRFFGVGSSSNLAAIQPRYSSTKTQGLVGINLLMGAYSYGEGTDRLLNGPTNEAWIDPWLTYLRQGGVDCQFGATLKKINFSQGRIQGVVIEQAGKMSEVQAEHYLFALPVEVLARHLCQTPEMLEYDPTLKTMLPLAKDVAWIVGVVFYLKREIDIVAGPINFLDAPWALTGISQHQFWPNTDLTQYGNGTVRTILSTVASNWDAPGILYGKAARQCTAEEIRDEIWAQMKKSLNVGGKAVLRDEDLERFYIDPHLVGGEFGRPTRNEEPLLLNRINTWHLRPEASCRIENMSLAGDFVKTNTDLATTEGANEAARRAVNCILKAAGSNAKPCRIWPWKQPAMFAIRRWADEKRYRRGMPWSGDLSLPLRIAEWFWILWCRMLRK